MKFKGDTKISNYKLTLSIAFFMLLVIKLLIVTIIISEVLFLKIFLSGFIIVISLLLLHIQCLVYENSGHCITFTNYHPFTLKKFVHPFVELPQSSIKDFNFCEGIILNKLILKIGSKKRKSVIIKMKMLGFSHSQSRQIISSLQSIRSENKDYFFTR